MKLARLLLAVTAGTLIPLAPVAAHADSLGHRDAGGDLRSVAYVDGKAVSSPSTAEPTKALGDVTGISVAHTAGTVKVVMRFRELSPAGFGQLHEFQFITPTRNRLVYLEAGPGRWGGKATMRTIHDKKVSCSLGHRIDYARNLVVLRVPRSCLGRPRAVVVGAATLVGYGSKIYYDDAWGTGGEFTDSFVLSPRIHR